MQKGIFTAALWGVAGSWQLEEETGEYGAKHGVAEDGGPGCHQEAQGCTDLQCAGTSTGVSTGVSVCSGKVMEGAFQGYSSASFHSLYILLPHDH